MESETLKEKRIRKEAYEGLINFFNNMTMEDKKDVVHTLMEGTFKYLHMDPNQIENYMVHNIKTCEERYTLEEFSLALFKYFLGGVDVIICDRFGEIINLK